MVYYYQRRSSGVPTANTASAPASDWKIHDAAGGLKSAADTQRLNVVTEIDMTGKGIFALGPNPGVYAYTRVTVQRNILQDSARMTSREQR